MSIILAAHVIVGVLAAALGSRLGTRVFLLGALAPLTTVAWIGMHAGTILDGEPVVESYRWVPGLGLDLSFRVDALALVMLGIVSGIGLLVFVYASRYFHGNESGLQRLAGLLVAFAAAMTGLVSADDLLAVFVFWELTSITSYGLIGFNDRTPSARAAAVQALIITGAGGLALLAGLLLVRISSGAGSFSELEGVELEGGLATVAAVLVLAGAFTKSAQAPFHGWLPGAMAAPTPISAYLHSATMVKAGVFLIARLSPAFHGIDLWPALTVGVGTATMLWGGYRSLRQTDLKLLLAYGTVSQLGMLVATFGAGNDKLYTAGVAMLIAHALFKATLFMAVGVIDHATHTREVQELSGIGRGMPVVASAAVIASASMAGLIPLFGFVAKEAVLAGLVESDFALAGLATAGIVLGSGLTAAYTLRFLWGAFWDKPGVTTEIHRPDPVFVSPTVVLAVPTVLLGLATTLADEIVLPAAAVLDAAAGEHHLHLWAGFETPFWLSMIALSTGAVLFALRRPVEQTQRRLGVGPNAASIFQGLITVALRGAARATGMVQTGSLPLYLGIIIATAVAVPTAAILTEVEAPDGLVLADSWLQGLLAISAVVAASAVIWTRRRFSAVLLLGLNGFIVAGLFVIHGAPDLALTQVLVEIVVVVVYVLVLRQLPELFPRQHVGRGALLRGSIAAVVGVSVFVLMITSIAERTERPVDDQIAELAYPEGDGKNVVNVTLVDIRGFDTMGEIIVLVVAALGVAALIRGSRSRRHGDGHGDRRGDGHDEGSPTGDRPDQPRPAASRVGHA